MSVLTATGAGVRHHRRWLVRDLDLTVEPGETIAVTGPPGSGRTSTLLLLARRLRPSVGRVSLSGTASLAHVPGVTDLEPVFTVAEHVRERLALLGRPRRQAAAVPLHGLDPALRGRDLTPFQTYVLGLVLAGLSEPAVIALDGVDAGLDAAESAELWRLLGDIAAGGTAVLVTARAVDPARVSRVVQLSDPQHGEPGTTRVRTAAEYAAEPAAPGTAHTEPSPNPTPAPEPSPELNPVPEPEAEPNEGPEPLPESEPAPMPQPYGGPAGTPGPEDGTESADPESVDEIAAEEVPVEDPAVEEPPVEESPVDGSAVEEPPSDKLVVEESDMAKAPVTEPAEKDGSVAEPAGDDEPVTEPAGEDEPIAEPAGDDADRAGKAADR